MHRDERALRPRVLSFLLLVPLAGEAESLFDDGDVLEVRIAGPIDSLIREEEQREELPFVLTTEGVDHAVTIRVRGKSRARVCDFPPLRLNFRTAEVADSVLAGQDKLKLVTHCKNYDRGETDMLQEYVAYRVFNALTDLSYRVRLLRIHYVDSDERLTDKAANRYGFVLEPAAAFASRVGAKRHRTRSIRRGALDLDYAALVFVYQYLVANTDWALVHAEGVDECCHNIDLFRADTGVLLVPYDLDLSGVVNARYAYPDRSLRIKRVTQRLYRGMCMQRDIVRTALRHVVSRREAILAIPGNTPGLTAKVARDTRRFLDTFFALAADEDKLLDNFEKRCIEPRYRPVQAPDASR